MTKLSLHRIGAFAAVSFLTLTVLTACSTAAQDQTAAEAYIRANVSELSPTPAILGGTFQVTDIAWQDDDTAIVSYEDGHIALQGRTDIVMNGDDVMVTEFVIIEDYGYDTSSSASGSVITGSGSSSSVAQRALSKEGELCGGIAGFQCEPGLFCKYDGAYPDAAGTCIK